MFSSLYPDTRHNHYSFISHFHLFITNISSPHCIQSFVKFTFSNASAGANQSCVCKCSSAGDSQSNHIHTNIPRDLCTRKMNQDVILSPNQMYSFTESEMSGGECILHRKKTSWHLIDSAVQLCPTWKHSSSGPWLTS